MTQISRDSFARTTLHRDVVEEPSACIWCGQHRLVRGGTRRSNRMFVYSTVSDGGKVSRHRGHFCSKSCHDSYHS